MRTMFSICLAVTLAGIAFDAVAGPANLQTRL